MVCPGSLPTAPTQGWTLPWTRPQTVGVIQGRVVQRSHLVGAPKGLLGMLLWLALLSSPRGGPARGGEDWGPVGWHRS